jgi:hypothetical protein
MSNIVNIQEKLDAKHERDARRKSIAGTAAVALLGLGVLTANVVHEKNSANNKADFILEQLSTGGLERGITMTFGEGTQYRSTPVTVEQSQDGPSNVVGEIGQAKTLKIENPVVVEGNDGQEYVITLNPTSIGKTPGSISGLSEFSSMAVAIPVNDGQRTITPGSDGLVNEAITGDRLPNDANIETIVAARQ